MSEHFEQATNDIMNGVGLLRQQVPGVMKAIGALSTTATVQGRN